MSVLHTPKHIIVQLCLLGLVVFLASCSTHALREAQYVVAQADSLRSQGKLYEDSARLAQAYSTLNQWHYFYADDFVHACYHYGRLLRAKDNPVEAMQAFICATHSRTRDNSLLGRVYSNMGDICHYASEYALSYDMFKISADRFICSGDTLAYYYSLYHMAYEKAIGTEKDSCRILLNRIHHAQLHDDMLSACCLLTYAEMHLRCQHYDSAVSYAYKALSLQNTLFLPVIQLAQAYSLLGQKDSAVWYAQKVLNNTNELFAANNALYVLTNDDETKDITAIRQTAADRADIQKLLEIRQGKLSQAVQLLEQDLYRKPNLMWLYTLFVTLLIIGICISTYVQVKRKKQNLLSQKVNRLKQSAYVLLEKHNEINKRYAVDRKRMEDDIQRRCFILMQSENLRTKLAWKDYDEMCQVIDEYFYMLASKLHNKEVLNETELRLCVLVMLGMNRAEISNTLPYALNSVGKLKDHTAKLLGTTGKNLRQYLMNMAIDG